MQESHRSVLKLIGYACPLLTHLSTSGFCVTAKDYLSLILGEFGDDELFHEFVDSKVWSEDSSSLEFLQVPSEILTPICFTLRALNLSFGSEIFTDVFYSLAAFVLRHLPSLEKMDGHHTSFGVEKLKNSIVPPNEAKKRKLNKPAQMPVNKLSAFHRRPGIDVFINRPIFSGEFYSFIIS